jgi:MFS family permease
MSSSQKRVLPILFGTLLLDMVGTGMIFPIIPIIFTDPNSHAFLLHGYSQGMQFFLAGLVTALFGLMQFIAAPLLGELSDVYGRKKLLSLGIGTLAVSQILFGFGIEIASIPLILFSRAIAGLAAANFSIAQATIADVTEPKDRAKNFGLIGAAFGTGFIVGPLLGGWIAGLTGDPAAPFWFAGALGVINLTFVTLMLQETNLNPRASHGFTVFKGIRNIQAAIRDVDARPVYLTTFLYMSGFTFMTSFMGVFLVGKFGFDETAVGTFFAAVGAWVIFTQLFLLRILASKYSERQIVRYTMLIMGAAMIAYPLLPSVPWLYIVMPFIAVSQGLTMANLTSLVSKSVSAERQGAALGINGSLMAFSQGAIPLVAGIGTGVIGISMPLIIGGIIVWIAWSVLFIFMRRRA